MSAIDWRQRIVELVLVKQTIHQYDTKHLWEYRLPRPAASVDELDDAEAALGEPLDAEYRRFLSFGNGWPSFFQSVDLFGSVELIGGARWDSANMLLDEIEADVLAQSGVTRDQIFPIAASSVEIDVFVAVRCAHPAAGQILWFAGGEIDRFAGFDSYFASMVTYNRNEATRLRAASLS